MSTQLLEIQPKELKFIFILKKQCSCSVTLTNNTDQYVAFKVKTTSPKKYCVRPNVGIIKPKSIRKFTVTMQAQLEAPPDLICRDKFLIQSIVVPAGTAEEDVTSATFVKGSGRYIGENKLKVALVSPPNSPVLSPLNGAVNQVIDYEASVTKEPVISRAVAPATLQMVPKVEESINFEDLKPAKDADWKPKKDMYYAEDLKPMEDAELKPRDDAVNGEDLRSTKAPDLKPKNDFVNGKELKPVKDEEPKPMKDALDTKELKSMKEKEFNILKGDEVKTLNPMEELKLVKDVEEVKSKLSALESKLDQVEATISKLTEERRLSTQERKTLQEELALLRKKTNVRRVQVGFPLLFVCMVALVSIYVGYHLHH